MPELPNTINIVVKMCAGDFTQLPESVGQAKVVFDILGTSLLECYDISADIEIDVANIIKEYCMRHYKPTDGNIIAIDVNVSSHAAAVKWLYAACIISICGRYRITMCGDIFEQASGLLYNTYIQLGELERRILQRAVQIYQGTAMSG